jgi:hypothetical protein
MVDILPEERNNEIINSYIKRGKLAHEIYQKAFFDTHYTLWDSRRRWHSDKFDSSSYLHPDIWPAGHSGMAIGRIRIRSQHNNQLCIKSNLYLS